MFVALKKYAVFSGRAARSEYWLFVLLYFIVSIVVIAIAGEGSVLLILIGLALIIPSIAVAVRRLHDLDKSGWWALIMLVPILSIGLIIYFCFKGTDGSNRFGPDPLRPDFGSRPPEHDANDGVDLRVRR